MGTLSLLRASLILGLAASASGVVWVAVHGRGGVDDRIAIVAVVRLLLIFAVGAGFLWFRSGSAIDRLAAFDDRRPRLVIAGFIAISAFVVWLTTPQISFGGGYGHDGVLYGWMTEHFSWSPAPAPGAAPQVYRVLAPLVVHSSGFSTFHGYAILNLASHAVGSVLLYLTARRLLGSPFASLLAMALFAVSKFAFKFWAYYPVLPDGLASLLLMAILYATIARREVPYLLAMTAGVWCREDLLALIGFNVLHAARTASRPGLWRALALQAIPLLGLAASRAFPVFRPALAVSVTHMAIGTASQVLADPLRVALAYMGALGVLVLLPAFQLPRFARFFTQRYEWLYYLVATLALALVRFDVDRLATWAAPALILGLLSDVDLRELPARRLWASLFLVQVVWMELVLPWFPDERFYLARYASHARGAAYAWIVVASCALVLVVTALVACQRSCARAVAGGRRQGLADLHQGGRVPR